MLITETVEINGVEYLHNYSDAGFKIEQLDTGIIYDDAIDVLDTPHTYAETEEKIEEDELDELEALALAGRILLGEEEV